jgi:hypothetical protein
MIEAILTPTNPGLEADELSNLGQDQQVATFRVNIADQPLARRLPPSFLGAASKRFDAIFVPHTVNILRVEGFREITQFGIHIKYIPDEIPGQTLSVIELVPKADFVKNGEFAARLSATAGLSTMTTEAPTVGEPNFSKTSLFELTHGLEAGATATLQCRFSVLTPQIAALGIGSREVTWVFDVGGTTKLHGTPIETWSLLVAPKGIETIRYSVRLWMKHRVVFPFTSHWEWDAPEPILAKIDAFPETLGPRQ